MAAKGIAEISREESAVLSARSNWVAIKLNNKIATRSSGSQLESDLRHLELTTSRVIRAATTNTLPPKTRAACLAASVTANHEQAEEIARRVPARSL